MSGLLLLIYYYLLYCIVLARPCLPPSKRCPPCPHLPATASQQELCTPELAYVLHGKLLLVRALVRALDKAHVGVNRGPQQPMGLIRLLLTK